MAWPGVPFPYSSLFNIRKKIPDNLVSSAVQNLPNLPFRQDPYPGMVDPNWGPESTFPAPTPKPSGGNIFANLLGRPETDTDFWDSLKEQLGEAGADYDAADQPFKSLSPVSVPGARHQPVANPSILTTRGIPTGGSYNPYLGDPAKRKPRPR